MSAKVLPAEQASTAPFTLTFTEWCCGHHGQRPTDIPVHSTEQATLILQAIAHAITQPGHARAVLFSEDRYTSIYLTDDYAEPITVDYSWSYRTVIHHGTIEEIEALRGVKKQVLDECFAGPLEVWDGKQSPDDYFEVLSTLSVQEIEEACKPVEWHEVGTRIQVCTELKPLIKPVALLLGELREYQAEYVDKGVGADEAGRQGAAQS